jgi:hypothetical protein
VTGALVCGECRGGTSWDSCVGLFVSMNLQHPNQIGRVHSITLADAYGNGLCCRHMASFRVMHRGSSGLQSG